MLQRYVCIISEMSQFLYQVDEGRKMAFQTFFLSNNQMKKQVDILISKNQALQILYLKHIKLHKLATMDRNPRKFNPHK